MTRAREPHHGDGKGKPIEIKHERTLREILASYPLLGENDDDDLYADLLALIRAREAMTRERCASIVFSASGGNDRLAREVSQTPLPCDDRSEEDAP